MTPPADGPQTEARASEAPVPADFLRLRDDALQVLAGWRAPDPAQERLRTDYLDHLRAEPGAAWRGGPPSHLTVGMLVLDENGDRVLLTHHRKARRWFQLGGHLEAGDASLAAGAVREGVEESGLTSVRAVPGVLQLDRHPLPGAFGRCREHLDVRFLGIAPAGARPVVSEESLDVAWFDVDDLPNPELAALVAAGRARLAAGL